MDKEISEDDAAVEKPNAFWSKIYFAVIINTVLVIAALWAFSRYFSQ